MWQSGDGVVAGIAQVFILLLIYGHLLEVKVEHLSQASNIGM